MSMGIGYMPMPEGFRYAELAKAGRPQHKKFDEFWCRHPPMELGKRAKIFAPFAALKGFEEKIDSSQRQVRIEQEREIEYVPVYESSSISNF